MTSKKNKFWNLCISCMPGAGQMYQGFLKRGTSLMLLFFGEILIANMLYADWLLCALPIIWCYAFFDSLNTNSLSDAEFSMLEDKYLFIEEDRNFNFNLSRIRIPAAVILIIAGSYAILENMFYIFEDIFNIHFKSHIIYWIMDYCPRFVFSVVIILTGLYLIKEKKEQIDSDGMYGNEKDRI